MSEKRRTVVAPWKNIAEFQQVYDAIYGKHSTEYTQRQALSQIRVWSIRRSVLCPAGALATSVLLNTQLLDGEQRYEESEMQTLYANAFMRFFNFMSSIMQTHNMRTMYETARELGLDSFVVDMRHLCAHGQELPPLQLLRSTTAYCMQWLGDYFWRSQLASMREVDASQIRRKDRTLFDDKILQLFSIYDSALECHLKGAHNMKTAKRHVHGQRYVTLKAYCEKHELTELRPVFDMLVQELNELVKRESGLKDLSDICIDALVRMKYFFVCAGSRKSCNSLEFLLEATQGLFRMLAVHGLLEDLFYALLQLAENPIVEVHRRAGASFWAAKIVHGFVAFRKCKKMYKAKLDENPKSMDYNFSSINVQGISKSMRKLLGQNGVHLKRTLIFGDSLKRPWVWVFERSFLEQHLESLNEYTAPVLKALLPLVQPALRDDEMQAILALIDALYGRNGAMDDSDESPDTTSTTNDDSSIYTAADLLTRLHKMPAAPTTSAVKSIALNESSDATQQLQYGLWSVVPDEVVHNWTICPLGKLPWN